MTDALTPAQLENLGLARTPTGPQTQSVGQEQFMQLMLAQFENQDPFEPLENGEFLAQLAQFTTASGIEELNQSFQGFSDNIYADQAFQAASLVGRDVLVASELVRTQGSGDAVSGAVDLEGASGNIEIDVLDGSGQLVRTLQLGVRQPGNADFRWDGITEEGATAAPGIYEFRARVTRGTQVESAATLMRTSVDSVTLGRNGEGVTINSSTLGNFSFGSIRQIFN
ncbi:MAG: flagellar hook assembly protein FlgD [Pseudomonadota bacterium]